MNIASVNASVGNAYLTGYASTKGALVAMGRAMAGGVSASHTSWADYQLSRNPAPWQPSPYDYLVMLRDAKAEYEVIGLQYYHSGRDLLEWERDLESFNDFGKPMHITEMGFHRRSLRTQGRRMCNWGGGMVARP